MNDIIKNKNTTFIDLRNQDELEEYGYLEESKHIPLMELPDHLEEVKKFSRPIVLFCKSGGRAERAKEFLDAQGLDEVYAAGGYNDVKKVLS